MKEHHKNREKINQKTTMFHGYIIEQLENNNLMLESETINSINDILYLINANYYYRITTKLHLDREELIERILTQIILHLQESDSKELKNVDIEKILNNCFFIKEKVQQSILKEYTNSVTIIEGRKIHNIENRYLDSEEHQKEIIKSKNECFFDTTNLEYYKALVEGLTATDKYLQDYGNINNIEWDYQILQDVISIMLANYRKEIKGCFEVGAYSDFNLISNYIYNVMCYSVMNQKAVVNYQSLLSTFKDWDELPYKLKLKITTKIIKELNLTNVSSPYIQKYKPKQKGKIVSIFTRKEEW